MGDAGIEYRIARLRGLRVREEWDRSLGVTVRAIESELKQAERRLGGVGAVLAEVCPARLLAHCRVRSVSRGTLIVEVDQASARYQLDRWLRSGGETRLIEASGASIRRVKLVPGGDGDGGTGGGG